MSSLHNLSQLFILPCPKHTLTPPPPPLWHGLPDNSFHTPIKERASVHVLLPPPLSHALPPPCCLFTSVTTSPEPSCRVCDVTGIRVVLVVVVPGSGSKQGGRSTTTVLDSVVTRWSVVARFWSAQGLLSPLLPVRAGVLLAQLGNSPGHVGK